MDPAHTTWSELVLPVLAVMDRAEVARQSGLSRRTIERYLFTGMLPHRSHEATLSRIAVEWATASLGDRGLKVLRADLADLYRYLRSVNTPANGSRW